MSIGKYLILPLVMQETMDANMKDWQDRILDEWERSKKYPRKKKKRVRKELKVEWAIATWKPEFLF